MKLNVAIVGATGLVGRTFVEILEQREFPVAELRLLASERSAGTELAFRGQKVAVQPLSEAAFEGVELALFSAGAEVSKRYAPAAVAAGATVIDNSSAFRMEEDVPLVVPEVNPEALGPEHKIIANPNCSTIQTVVAVKPLHDAARIKRMVVSTYQAVSGKGADAVQRLQRDCQRFLAGDRTFDPNQIAFNAVPHIDVFLPNGSTKEEMKMVQETRKILAEPALAVFATCVRVPVMNGHSCSVNLEFERALALEDAREILREAAGVVLMDEPDNGVYPTPLMVSGRDQVFVGRVREDPSVSHGLSLWVVADNLRKGAALNAVQIAERLISH